MKIQFFAGEGINYLLGEDDTRRIYAECEVPEGASEDYGYITMKKAIEAATDCTGIEFWYDGQEQYLEADAAADCAVDVDIEED